jgi:aspartate racemase
MKHLGIVACSAEGAALCYRTICQLGVEAFGANQHPRITLDSIPMATWMPAFDANDLDALAGLLLESARLLAAAGADVLLCPDNSAHLGFPGMEAVSPRPWLHIAEVVAAEAVARGFRRVGVLGTRFTMAGPVYPERLGARGIETIFPSAVDQEVVDGIIFDELVNGVFTERARRAYREVIEALRQQGCDAVALACTEIPLLIGSDDSVLPTLDSTRLLARAALTAVQDGTGPRCPS